MKRLEAKSSVVIVVDVQERLLSVMPQQRGADVVRAARLLCEGARLLGAPVLATQQYTKGLGPTVAPVEEALVAASAARFEKVSFSAVPSSCGVRSIVTVVEPGGISVKPTSQP